MKQKVSELQQARDAALAFLAATQHVDGGWGYLPGQSSVVEPTAAATIALEKKSEFVTTRERAVAWLAESQHPDGGWGITADDPESGWQTAWAVLALRSIPELETHAVRALDWLVGVESWELEAVDVKADVGEMLAFDLTVYGWPWMPGEATWVEPTALALLALADVPHGSEAVERLERALRFLEDRRCRDGGWNVGNPVMLGAYLPPRAHPTAWALLALARLAPDAIVAKDIVSLRQEIQSDSGTLAMAWGILALRAVGENVDEVREWLTGAQAPNGGWNENSYHTAVAALSLADGSVGVFEA